MKFSQRKYLKILSNDPLRPLSANSFCAAFVFAGTSAYDATLGIPMMLADTSLSVPSWQPSDAPVPVPSFADADISSEVGFIDPDDVPGWVKTFCADVILDGPLHR